MQPPPGKIFDKIAGMEAAIVYTLVCTAGGFLLYHIIRHAVVHGIVLVIGMLAGRGTSALAVRAREDAEVALAVLVHQDENDS